jgi:8-oxo-dGTP pyrophosphatase MutT (NUDIX family)
MIEQKRKALLGLLADFQAQGAAQEDQRKQIIALVSNAERCAWRDNFVPGHVTGSAWIVNQRRDRALLLHHGKLNRWLQPGGHADGEFDLASVAFREASEETGLRSIALVRPTIFDIDIHFIPARKDEPDHLHFDVRFLFSADDTEPLVMSEESRDVQWVLLSQLTVLTREESVLRMARAM